MRARMTSPHAALGREGPTGGALEWLHGGASEWPRRRRLQDEIFLRCFLLYWDDWMTDHEKNSKWTFETHHEVCVENPLPSHIRG